MALEDKNGSYPPADLLQTFGLLGQKWSQILPLSD